MFEIVLAFKNMVLIGIIDSFVGLLLSSCLLVSDTTRLSTETPTTIKMKNTAVDKKEDCEIDSLLSIKDRFL